MTSITPIELRDKLNTGNKIFMIDVREAHERDEFHIGGEWFPSNEIFEHANKIPKDQTVIVYCQKGIRSGLVIQRLQQRFGFKNLVNLAGGLDAWRMHVGK